MNDNRMRRTFGIISWCILGASAYIYSAPLRESGVVKSSGILQFASRNDDLHQFEDRVGRLQPMDPIFALADSSDPDSWKQVGYVDSISPDEDSVTLRWYDSEIDIANCRLLQHHDNGSLERVVATLFPLEKQNRIRIRISDAIAKYGNELGLAFEPLVRKTLRESLPIIEEEFRKAVAANRGEIDKLARDWNREIVEKRLIPLAKRELMPIVRKHGEPVAMKIGRKVWDRASLWSFGWRAIYDKSPLPKKNLLQKEFDRFLEKEAMPIFEAHSKDILAAVQKTIRDVTNNKAVRRELADVGDELVDDPAARSLVRTLLRQTLLENERLKQTWREVWTSNEAQKAMQLAGDRLEPIVRNIGDEIFGTQEAGIDPGFARVLRSQILQKDRRWIVAYAQNDNAERRIALARDPMPFPVIYLASPESDRGQAAK